MKRIVAVTVFFLAGVPGAFAQSTVDPERAHAWSPSLGWVDWHPSEEYGAVIGEFVCSGYLWAPNAGWIHLGDGVPVDGIAYSNESGEDYGVNHRDGGRLRGLAWSRNIGWVVFHDRGDPRVNLATGELLGYAWMPNAGWLRLGDPFDDEPGMATRTVAAGSSEAGDGIPDAWRIHYGGSADGLPADVDSSGNGMTNREAYLAGLDPLDPNSRFAVMSTRPGTGLDGVSRVTLEWTGSPDRAYRIRASDDLEHWETVGPAVIVPGSMARYIIAFSGPVTGDDVALVRSAGGEVRHVFSIIDALSVTLPEHAVRDLLSDPRIDRITPDTRGMRLSGADDPLPDTAARHTHTVDVPDEKNFFRIEVIPSPLSNPGL